MTYVKTRGTSTVRQSARAERESGDVAGALVRRFGARIDRFRKRVRHPTRKTVIFARLPLELPGVIPALSHVIDDKHITVPGIGTTLVRARHTQAHFVRGN